MKQLVDKTVAYDVFTCIYMALWGSLLTLGLATETPSITWKVVYGTLFVLYVVAYFFCILHKKNTKKVLSVIMATLGVTLASAICSLFMQIAMWQMLLEIELLALFMIFFFMAIEAIRNDTEDKALKIAIASFFGAISISGIISMTATCYQFEELTVMAGVIEVLKNHITLDQLLIASDVMLNVGIASLLIVFSFIDVKLIKASSGLLGKSASIALTLLLIKLSATWLLGLFSLAMPHWIDVLFMIGIGLPGGLAILLFIGFIINKARE